MADCSICFERYHAETRVPKVLPCGHTFCEVCIASIGDANSGRRGMFQQQITPLECPNCRTGFTRDEAKTNFSFLEFMNATAHRKSLPSSSNTASGSNQTNDQNQNNGTMCTVHPNNRVDVYCIQCNVLCCHHCYAASNAAHATHHRISISDVTTKLPEYLRRTSRGVDSRFEAVKGKVADLQQQRTGCQRDSMQLRAQVTTFFEQAHAHLANQRTKMLADLDAHELSLSTEFQKENERWMKCGRELEALKGGITQLTQNLNDQRIQREASGGRSQASDMQRQSIDIQLLAAHAELEHKIKEYFANQSDDVPVQELLSNVRGCSLDQESGGDDRARSSGSPIASRFAVTFHPIITGNYIKIWFKHFLFLSTICFTNHSEIRSVLQFNYVFCIQKLQNCLSWPRSLTGLAPQVPTMAKVVGRSRNVIGRRTIFLAFRRPHRIRTVIVSLRFMMIRTTVYECNISTKIDHRTDIAR